MNRSPLAIELTVEAGGWPEEARLRPLVETAVTAAAAAIAAVFPPGAELGVTFTDDAHVRRLNAQWRGKDKPTNVLSFPAFPVVRGASLPPLLGDIVVAAETVAAEALAENKTLEHHLCHLVIHGFLHLAGYDHETEDEAEMMESIERAVLAKLAIADPYA